MKKKLLLILTALLLICVTAFCLTACDFNFINNNNSIVNNGGNTGDNTEQEPDDNNDNADDNSESTSFVIYELFGDYAQVVGYEGASLEVVIAEEYLGKPVKHIAEGAFRNSKITSVTIGNSVTSIGEDAFSYCNSLTSIEIPNSVTSIGDSAFSNCNSLTSIEIPNSVTSIGDSAFYGCDSLIYNEKEGLKYLGNQNNKYLYLVGPVDTSITTANLDSNCSFIGKHAFLNCSSLTSIEIPNSVTSIGEQALFYGCDSLIYNEKEGLKYLGNQNNKYLYLVGPVDTNITTANLDSNCSFIGDSAFYYCDSLISVTIPNSVTSIVDFAFVKCDALTSIEIPNSITSIGDRVFYMCDALTSVTFEENSQLTSIGYGAFEDCRSLTNIEIPDSVTSIGNYAFSACRSLTNVEIPNRVTSIGDYAFV